MGQQDGPRDLSREIKASCGFSRREMVGRLTLSQETEPTQSTRWVIWPATTQSTRWVIWPETTQSTRWVIWPATTQSTRWVIWPETIVRYKVSTQFRIVPNPGGNRCQTGDTDKYVHLARYQDVSLVERGMPCRPGDSWKTCSDK